MSRCLLSASSFSRCFARFASFFAQSLVDNESSRFVSPRVEPLSLAFNAERLRDLPGAVSFYPINAYQRAQRPHRVFVNLKYQTNTHFSILSLISFSSFARFISALRSA
jgi:hypothetical protein